MGLLLLLLFLWLYNSYQQGDFQTTTPKESMAQMDPRFPVLPHSEFSDKQNQLEIDLEQYEQTVNAINDTIRERIHAQEYVLDDTQVQLRPIYDTPRNDKESNHTSSNTHHEQINPPPVPKLPNAIG